MCNTGLKWTIVNCTCLGLSASTWMQLGYTKSNNAKQSRGAVTLAVFVTCLHCNLPLPIVHARAQLIDLECCMPMPIPHHTGDKDCSYTRSTSSTGTCYYRFLSVWPYASIPNLLPESLLCAVGRLKRHQPA